MGSGEKYIRVGCSTNWGRAKSYDPYCIVVVSTTASIIIIDILYDEKQTISVCDMWWWGAVGVEYFRDFKIFFHFS